MPLQQPVFPVPRSRVPWRFFPRFLDQEAILLAKGGFANFAPFRGGNFAFTPLTSLILPSPKLLLLPFSLFQDCPPCNAILLFHTTKL